MTRGSHTSYSRSSTRHGRRWRCASAGRHAFGEGLCATELGRRVTVEGHAEQGRRTAVRHAVGLGSRATEAAEAWSWGATPSGRASAPPRQAASPPGGPRRAGQAPLGRRARRCLLFVRRIGEEVGAWASHPWRDAVRDGRGAPPGDRLAGGPPPGEGEAQVLSGDSGEERDE